jgi:dCMP deaminase
MNNNFDDWDHFFMSLCYFVAGKSKDNRTQVGAVIVRPENDSYVTGYNGFPRGLKETKARMKRPQKYMYIEHSERNAIYNSARNGISTKGSRIYVPWVPCPECAKGIIQSGIVEVITHKPHPYNCKINIKNDGEARHDWARDHKEVLKMFAECGIKLREYDGPILREIGVLYDGEYLDPSKFS